VEKRLNDRRLVADKVVEGLYDAADAGRFGALIRSLEADPGDLTDILYQVHMRSPADSAEKPVMVSSQGRLTRRIAPGARLRPGQAAPGGAEPAPEAPRPMTMEDLYASAALKHWMKAMHTTADSNRASRSLNISNENFSELVGEITAGARRLKLADRIAAEIRSLAYIERGERSAVKAALVASRYINRFIVYLGFDMVPEDQRPRVSGEGIDRPVFAARPTAFDLAAIGAEPVPFRENYLLDWIFAFYKLVEDNATSEGGQQFDIEQNSRLGRIIGVLAQPL
jgi:hypothetical protein